MRCLVFMVFMALSPMSLRPHQDLDTSVALPTRLVLLGALRALLAERAGRDLVPRNARRDDRVANGVHAPPTQREVVLVRATGIRESVEADDEARVLLQIVDQVPDLPLLRCPNVRLVEVEQNVGERLPHRIDALLARGSRRA